MDPSKLFSSKETTLEDILNLNKQQITLYLRSRKQKISGNKHELAKRALKCHANEFGELDIVQPSCRSTEDSQTSSRIESLPCYTELSSGWTSDLALLPKMTVSDIENYLINSSHRTSDSLKMECYRQYIRGLNFYKEKYIHKIMINSISESSEHCYIRSKCHPSMKQGVYIQWVLMTKKNPITILKASCTCPAGLGEGCTHISGLLFAIEGNTQENNDNIACTSKPCQWNKPSKRKKDPQPVENIKFKKIKLHESENNSNCKSSQTREKASDEEICLFRNKLCSRLGNQSNAVLFDLLPPCSNETAVECDLNLGKEEIVETSKNIVYQSDKYINLKKTIQEDKMTASEFLKKMSAVDPDVVAEIEVRTRGQDKNPLWFMSRKGRITASIYHDVLHRKITTHSNKLVEKIVSNSDEDTCLNVPALKWGRKMEIVAKKQYKAVKKLRFNQNVKIVEQGLYIHPQHSFLGASPDGLVVQSEESFLIEVKCPYKWRFKTVTEACSDTDFCCYIDKNGTISLKEKHRYYTQIQGQMGICGIRKCDLVIYTTKDLRFLTISFNPVFWGHLLKHLNEFYSQHVLPSMTESSN